MICEKHQNGLDFIGELIELLPHLPALETLIIGTLRESGGNIAKGKYETNVEMRQNEAQGAKRKNQQLSRSDCEEIGGLDRTKIFVR